MPKEDFYFAFEAKYRGSRELIKNRQKVYLPFIDQLKSLYADCSAFDIGCGRGEWLELLAENNVLARGVDLDDDMVSACQESLEERCLREAKTYTEKHCPMSVMEVTHLLYISLTGLAAH